METQPRDNQSIFQHLKYYQLASNAIKNWNKKFGIKFDVYRVAGREKDKDILSWGPSSAQPKSNRKLKYLKTICAFNSPTEIYNKIHANEGGLQIKLGEPELLVGDILKLPWVDGKVLEFAVNEQPQTYANVFFVYNLESIFSSC